MASLLPSFDAGRLSNSRGLVAQHLSTKKAQGGSMALRGQHYHLLHVFGREMESLFNRFFGGGALAPFEDDFGQWSQGGFEVEEDDKEMVVRADVPSFEEKELDVRLEGDVLTIQAEKEQMADNQRQYRTFFRQLTLPPGIDADKVQATYRNGVLELRIPRPEGRQAKRIAVQGHRPGTAQVTSAKAGLGTPRPRGGRWPWRGRLRLATLTNHANAS